MENQSNFFPFLGISNVTLEDVDTSNRSRYEIYVNGDFMGFKTLYTSNEDITDLHDFLYEQGFPSFNAQGDGDHYEIRTDESDDALKQVLQVHLQMY